MNPSSPDLSGLTEQERQHIESVLSRQRLEDEKETEALK